MGGFPKLAGAAPAAGLLAACANGVEMAAEGPGATRRTALDEVFTGAKGMNSVRPSRVLSHWFTSGSLP